MLWHLLSKASCHFRCVGIPKLFCSRQDIFLYLHPQKGWMLGSLPLFLWVRDRSWVLSMPQSRLASGMVLSWFILIFPSSNLSKRKCFLFILRTQKCMVKNYNLAAQRNRCHQQRRRKILRKLKTNSEQIPRQSLILKKKVWTSGHRITHLLCAGDLLPRFIGCCWRSHSPHHSSEKPHPSGSQIWVCCYWEANRCQSSQLHILTPLLIKRIFKLSPLTKAKSA